MTTLTIAKPSPHLSYLLRLADDQLILGHRLSEWTGRGPLLEEDIALANIGLDHIGAARALYDRASEVHGQSLTEDDYAYRRDSRGYFNLLLVERPNGDFAHTMVRQLFYSAFAHWLWDALAASKDETLAAIAERSVKEARYHLRHASTWVVRLGDGTDESRQRTVAALDALWPYTGELFEVDDVLQAMIDAGIATDPAPLRDYWDGAVVDGVLSTAGLETPTSAFFHTGGRTGKHTEHLGHILSDLQYLQRAYPGASW